MRSREQKDDEQMTIDCEEVLQTKARQNAQLPRDPYAASYDASCETKARR